MCAGAQGEHPLADPRPARGQDSPVKRVLIHVALIFAALVALFPVIRVFSTALRPGDNPLNTSLDIIPKGATLDAFHRVLFDSSLPNWLFNSLVVTLGTATVGLILAATSAYAFSRHKFRGRALGLTFLFATQLIPGIMLLVPIYLLAIQLNLVGTYQGLVIAYAVTAVPFSIWILKGYYDTIPIDLEEAALIDGCTSSRRSDGSCCRCRCRRSPSCSCSTSWPRGASTSRHP